MKDVTQSQNEDSWVVWIEQGFEMNSKWNAIQMMGVPAASSLNTRRVCVCVFAKDSNACCSAMRKILRADEVEDPQFPVLFQRKIRARANTEFRVPNHTFCMHVLSVVRSARNKEHTEQWQHPFFFCCSCTYGAIFGFPLEFNHSRIAHLYDVRNCPAR